MQVELLFGAYLLVALILSIFFNLTRRFHRELSPSEHTVALSLTAFTALIFSLLLGFTVSNFLERFLDIRNTMIEEVTNLQLVYRALAVRDDTSDVIATMREYVDSVLNEEWPALEERKASDITEMKYRTMDRAIISYLETHPQFQLNVYDRLSTSERRKRLIGALKNNNTLIVFIIVTGIITLFGFWLLSNISNVLMWLLDFTVLAVIAIGIFMLVIFDRPFSVAGMGIPKDIYEDLAQELKGS